VILEFLSSSSPSSTSSSSGSGSVSDSRSVLKYNESEFFVQIGLTSSQISQFGGLNISSAIVRLNISSSFESVVSDTLGQRVYRGPEVGIQIIGVSTALFNMSSIGSVSWDSRPKYPISMSSSFSSSLGSKVSSGGFAFFDTVYSEISVVNGSQVVEFDVRAMIQNGLFLSSSSSSVNYLLLRVFTVREVYLESYFEGSSSSSSSSSSPPSTVASGDGSGIVYLNYSLSLFPSFSTSSSSSFSISVEIAPFLSAGVDSSVYISRVACVKKPSLSVVEAVFSNEMDGVIFSSISSSLVLGKRCILFVV